jgi:MFS family permease
MDAREKSISLRVAALQFGVVLSWTMYVMFLPGLLDRAGIDRHWLIWILILDQAVFAVSDWWAGSYADRASRQMRRVGPPLAAMAVLSSLAMASLPWVAELERPALLVAVVVFWVASSSTLRAPAFSLLSKVGGIKTRAGVVSVSLVGLSLASAMGPLVTSLLRGVDPRMPIVLAAIALAVAALLTSQIETRAKADDDELFTPSQDWVPLVLAAYVAALGTQLHNTLIGEALAPRFPAISPDLMRSTFWIGFTAGLLVAARTATLPNPLRPVKWALVLGAGALVVMRGADTIPLLTLAQLAAGGTWGVILTATIVSALSRESSMYAGTSVGLLFSALALAAMTRLIIIAAGIHHTAFMPWMPSALWLLAGLLMAWPEVRRRYAFLHKALHPS